MAEHGKSGIENRLKMAEETIGRLKGLLETVAKNQMGRLGRESKAARNRVRVLKGQRDKRLELRLRGLKREVELKESRTNI